MYDDKPLDEDFVDYIADQMIVQEMYFKSQLELIMKITEFMIEEMTQRIMKGYVSE